MAVVPAPEQHPPPAAGRSPLLRATVDRLVEPLIVAWLAGVDKRTASMGERLAALVQAHDAAVAAAADDRAQAGAAAAELERRLARAEAKVAALEVELEDERARRAAAVESLSTRVADQSALARRLASLEDAVAGTRG